ncbi:antibiotic biosynthesis monooxygenase family protein [Neisseria iguanae]|uniref:Antibiotic biosynthesis monooxygenase n=1 Tax=Neisseria iguanae TaxID=90242 RepID=A0A2P7U3K6_9NEIS|nr:antibiotic biosynthesis monooxygenase family protein [Neisseria iguanae]PSJ81495.1 antibiotic biosynthesis monooxygenase [Neisseria iguanae]
MKTNFKKSAVIATSITAVLMVAGCFGFGPKKFAKKYAEQVTLINVFEVPQGKVDEAIVSWEKSRDFLAKQPGYINTRLHRNIDADGKYQLINIAQWASPAEFQAATAKMRQELNNPLPEGTVATPALYEVTRVDGKDPFIKMQQKFLEEKAVANR